MSISVGKLLCSTPSMDDPHFEKTEVFIVEYNAQGALGFIVNQVFERPLNELEEFGSSPPLALYKGGPVDQEHLYFVHRRGDLIAGGTPVIDGICFGGDFKEAIRQLNQHRLSPSDIKIFIGYCGWDEGELEAEIAEGHWTVQQSDPATVFASHG